MMRYLLRTLFLLCTFTSFHPVSAQNEDTPKLNTLLPFPPSPSVSELGRYGSANASLSSGSINFSIPVYEYKTSNLSLPISINYISNGIRVDAIASRVGMGWMLNAGGVISRTVYGQPDEIGNRINAPNNTPFTPEQSWIDFLRGTLAADAQPDLFTFSFMNYNGKFIIENNAFIKLDDNNLKLEGNVISGFVITTPDGVKYEFTEQESSVSISSCLKGLFDRTPIPNAWVLTKIQHPRGDFIQLGYSQCEFTYTSSISQQDSKLKEKLCVGCPLPSPFLECAIRLKNYGLYLTSITSSQHGLIEFGYEPREDVIGDYKLKNILIKNSAGSVFKEIEFKQVYSNSTSFGNSYSSGNTKRLFLTDVIEKSSKGTAIKKHALHYNDINGLPPRLSYAQDYLGYFNGKTNTGLIPKPNDLNFAQYFQSSASANRHANHLVADKGLLNKITYPTGGSDSIVYEPHTIYSSSPSCNLEAKQEAYKEGTSEFKVLSTYETELFEIGCPQIIEMRVANFVDGELIFPLGEYGTVAELVNEAGQSLFSMSAGPNEINFYNYEISPGKYKVIFKVRGPSMGSASANYSPKINTLNQSVAGFRVKGIIRKSLLSAPEHINYTYNFSNGKSSGQSSNALPNYPVNVINRYFDRLNCSVEQLEALCVYDVCFYINVSSNSLYDFNSYSGNHIYYSTVTEEFGPQNENGGIEHTFDITLDLRAMNILGNGIIGAPLSNLGVSSGNEISTKYFKKANNERVVLKEVKNYYSSYNPTNQEHIYYITNAAANSLKFISCAENINNLVNIDVAEYKLLTRWNKLDSTVVNDFNADGTAPVISTSKYVYNNSIHKLPNIIQSTTSAKAPSIKQVKYPGDIVLTGDYEVARQALVTKGRIGVPLEETEQVNDAKKSVKTYYKQFSANIIEPERIERQINQGPGKTLLNIDTYDTQGNILSGNNESGIKIGFIWGYKNQFPIAEVKNATPDKIAYTSFENTQDQGNWSFPHTSLVADSVTGSKCLYFNPVPLQSVTKSAIPAGEYTLSLWAKGVYPTISGDGIAFSTGVDGPVNAAGWRYFERKITVASSGNLRLHCSEGYLDELRLYPVGAQMTTYTYNPLIGMTSSTDANNDTTYYIYDALGRLSLVKDAKGNILKKYEYKYANQ